MQNKLLNIATAAICTSLFILPVTAQADGQDIMELYSLAKAKDPVIGKSQARLEGSKADQDIAWSALYPRISANATQRKFWHTVENYTTTGNIDGSYDGFNYGITGQLPIINVPAYLQISAADAGIKSADAAISITRQDLIVRLVNAYVLLLKSQADEKLYRNELSRVSKILEQTEAFLKAGTGDVIAVYEAKARMDSAAADLIKSEAQRRIAEQILSSLTGITVTAVKDIPVSSPKGPIPNDLTWWIDTMQKQNPSLQQAKADLEQAGHYSDANRASHLPTIQLSGGYTVDKGSTFLPEVETKQWYIGASVSLPIYSGGETVARTRRAVANESERRFQLADVQDQNIKRLKESFLNLQYNVSLSEAFKRKLDSADLQLKATQKGRMIGTRTAIDLLNAEQTWATSNRDYMNSLYDNLARRMELAATAGILTEQDLERQGEIPTNVATTDTSTVALPIP